MPNILTCVYCGMEYPEGTPPHGSQILTDHIKICPKHPLRKAEENIIKLRNALIALLGIIPNNCTILNLKDTKTQLQQTELELYVGNNKSIIQAIDTLIDTFD